MAEETKRVRKAQKQVDAEKGIVTFTFTDSKPPFIAGLAGLPAPMVTRLALHGLSQKLGDSYAGGLDWNPTPAECREAATEMYASLKDGNWAERGEGMTHDSLMLQAIANIYCKGDLEQAKARKAKATDEQWKAVIGSPKAKAERARIVAARATTRAKEATGDLPVLPS